MILYDVRYSSQVHEAKFSDLTRSVIDSGTKKLSCNVFKM